MLLTNFKNLISGILLNRNCNVVRVAGNTITLTPSEIVGSDGLLNCGYMWIGTGNEDVKDDDYTFNFDNTSFTNSNQSTNILADRIVYNASFTNISTSDLVVTNVGVSVHDTSWAKQFFVEITKLDTPITIKAGETKTFTITINF